MNVRARASAVRYPGAGALLLALLLGGCGTIQGWLADEDNARPPAELTPIEAPVDIEVLWRARLGGKPEEATAGLRPVLADGRVYAATPAGVVAAFALDSGEPLWRSETGAALSGGAGIGEGRVVVGTRDAEVIALDREDGRELWRSKAGSEVLSAPAVARGRVVLQTVAGGVAALQAEDGAHLWSYDRNVPVLSLRGTGAPRIAGDLVLSGAASGKLTALQLERGWPKWEAAIAVPRGRSELERIVDVDAEPRIDEGVAYAAAYQGRVAAVDIESGRLIWARDLSSFAGIGLGPRRLYVTDEQSRVWALDPRNGASLWKQERLHDRALTAPVPVGDHVAVGDFEGYVHLLARADGRLAGRIRIDDGGIVAAPQASGDILIVLGRGGVLSALRIAR